MNTKRNVSWALYSCTLPLVFLSGMTFDGILKRNEQMELMERNSKDRDELQKVHREALRIQDETIKALQQKLTAALGQSRGSRDTNAAPPRSSPRSEQQSKGVKVERSAAEVLSPLTEKK